MSFSSLSFSSVRKIGQTCRALDFFSEQHSLSVKNRSDIAQRQKKNKPKQESLKDI